MLGRRAFVALTDGVDSAGRAEFETARAKLMRAGVASYFIQVNTEEFVENRSDEAVRMKVLCFRQNSCRRYRRVFQPREAEDLWIFAKWVPLNACKSAATCTSWREREMNELAKASGGKKFVANTLQDARAGIRLSGR